MSFLTRRVVRRLGPIGLAFSAYDLWSRLSPREQEHLIALARRHGTRSFKTIKRQSAKIQNRFA